MNITLDCLPCFVRHTIEVMRSFTVETGLADAMVRDVIRQMAEVDFALTPPEFAAEVHAMIRSRLGIADPYLQIKRDANRFAARLIPELEKRLEKSSDRLRQALLYSIAGNIIDSGVSAVTPDSEVMQSIEMAEAQSPAIDHSEKLLRELRRAEKIVILGDNAGEIYFDRLLLQELKKDNITYIVKGSPILNDALHEDAIEAGIDRYARVLDTGVAIPGTVLRKCLPAVLEAIQAADVIVSKGQANFETMGECADPRVFFTLRAKCHVIAREIGVPQGSFVIKSGG
ncbi:MAG TPA: ARMT1-like domain-containing protein [Candidatus Ozemobacteraceae bacterium]|nr:ARMT1-like domain-containing protein [Candidatus Ozemobacteraceae bacterium]